MTTDPQTTSPSKPSLWVDFGPLLIFFIVNFSARGFTDDPTLPILAATASLMATMPIAMAWSWKKRGHIPRMMWASLILVLIFGGLTLYLQDETFIKLKPTVLFTFFGLVLTIGALMGKPLLKYLMDVAFPNLSDRGWLLFSRNFGLLFLFKAGLNEYVWRNFSTDAWVTFKTFGFVGLTFLFVFTQMPMIMKNTKPAKPTGN